jgi:hypothetical protein
MSEATHGRGGKECGCGDGCCCGSADLQRRFQAKAEQIAALEEYLRKLNLETRAVEERMAELRR